MSSQIVNKYNSLTDITVAELAEVSENEDYLKSDEESTKRGGKFCPYNTPDKTSSLEAVIIHKSLQFNSVRLG